MTQKFKQLLLLDLDKRFKKIYFAPKPKKGWIRLIRTALSMPLSFPAEKLGISKQAIAKLEKSESAETISLKHLRQVAEAMGCELHYALVPHERTLKKIIHRQAEKKARAVASEVNDSMVLENQEITNFETSVKNLTEEFIKNLNKSLWS
jgi:predicted DNA-binding mobile mystery protein A